MLTPALRDAQHILEQNGGVLEENDLFFVLQL